MSGGTIRFRLNWNKAIEAIVWLAKQRPGISFFQISKILFYADKAHVQLYGRPVLGDTYIAMEHGPVPSGVRDLLTAAKFLDPDLLEQSVEAFTVEQGRVPKVVANREPDLQQFSESDLACLQEAFDKYVNMSFGRLRDLTHRERAWNEAPTNGAMDYTLMIEEDAENRDALIQEIRESAAYLVM